MRALVLLMFALVPLAARADPASLGRNLNVRLVANMFATTFAFMEPRTLEAVPIPTLAVWALGGLTVLDSRLAPDLHAQGVRLTFANRLLVERPAPAAGDALAWGETVAVLVHAGWDASAPVRQAGTQGVLRALLVELCGHFDPYTRYVPPAEADADRVHREGIARIGARVVARRDGFALQDVAPDGPAAAAGAHDGDRLLAVDGQSLADTSPATVAALLAGPEGTQVELTLRSGREVPRSVGVERRLVPPRTVVAERRADILVLRVSGFAADTGAQLADALADALDSGRRLRGVVIDLRGNRGGLLREAVAAAETLLANGVVAVTAGRDPTAAHSFVAHGVDAAVGLPVVVVVDGTSASSAEILAAALADQHRAVVVGSSTLGKGVVQTIAPLPDGGELFVSWSRVFAPLGWPLQGLGVLPQVCTSLGAVTLERQLARLAHGVQPMAEALSRHRAARPPLSPNEVLELRNACPAATGGALDLVAAHRLIGDPAAYEAALIGPPPTTAAALHASRLGTLP
ncbi:MAG TPA: S41 family peptidase [Acetobacteraceae bacterium]|nr:S41 family peptidase [Acetobacteraceae bacterium]